MTSDRDRADIVTLAMEVLGDESRANEWLSSPKQRFGGKTPIQLLDSADGRKAIKEVLLQAYFGNVG